MLLSRLPKPCHITPILRSLHWLKVTERIEYKLLSLTYKVLTTTQPTYLHTVTSSPFSLHAAPVLPHWSLSLVHPRHPSCGSQTVPFSMLHLVSWTSSRLLSDNLASTTLTLTHLFQVFLYICHLILSRRLTTLTIHHFFAIHPRLKTPTYSTNPTPQILSILDFLFLLLGWLHGFWPGTVSSEHTRYPFFIFSSFLFCFYFLVLCGRLSSHLKLLSAH